MNIVNKRDFEQADQAHLLDAIDRWLEREVKPVVKEHDHADTWPAEIVAQMRDMGLFGATVGVEYGGLGLPADHLRRNRDAHFRRVDGDHRHLQFAPDAGARDREIRHRATEEALAAGPGQRRHPRRACADRTGRRHRPAGHPHDGAPRRRRLHHQRHQDLDFQRHRRLVLCAAGEDEPGGDSRATRA